MNVPGLRNSQQRWLALAVAVAAVVAVFAGGAFTGRALADDEEKPATRLTFGQPPGSGAAGDGGADGLVAAEAVKRGAAGVATGGDLQYWPYCPGTLPAGVASSIIDPAAAGLAMRLLGAGFELQSITLRAQGECDESGNPINVTPALDTSWIHSGSGASVWVSQRESDEVANFMDQWSAVVWSDGYVFQVSAGGGVLSYAKVAAEEDAAVSSLAPDQVDTVAIQQALEEAVAGLAPGVALECFYRVVDGDWAALAALGLGDPRGAIPSGFAESYASIHTLQQPAANCDAPALENTYAPSLDASFTDARGGWIGVSAYRVFEAGVFPGAATPGSVYWADGQWQYGVYGYGSDGAPIDAETLTGIARALAPGFDEQCLAVDTRLSEAEVVAAGFNLPALPDEYTLQKSDFALNGVPSGCETGGDVAGGGYRLYWSYADGAGNTVDVSVTRPVPVADAPGQATSPGYLNEFGAGWTSADGTNYFVMLSAASGDRDLVTTVALSVDPGLDISTLDEGADALPARDGGGTPSSPS